MQFSLIAVLSLLIVSTNVLAICEDGQTTIEFNECLIIEIQNAEDELTKIYNEVESSLSTRLERDLLLVSQTHGAFILKMNCGLFLNIG